MVGSGLSSESRESGAIIVLSAIWIAAFLAFVALGLNIFFLGTMMIQQRTAAEYVALSAVKLMASPPVNARCRTIGQDYFQRVTCITDRSSVAAAVPMLGASYGQSVTVGQLTPQRADTSFCISTTQPDPQQIDTFSWIGFNAPSSGRGYIILGSYNATTRAFAPTCWSFITSSSMPSAAFVQINLRNNGTGQLAMPLINFFGGSSNIRFNSRAVAYLDGDLIVVARDPMIQ